MRAIFDRAREKMVSEPENLTDREIDTLEAGEPGLGQFARLRRGASRQSIAEKALPGKNSKFVDAVVTVLKGVKAALASRIADVESTGAREVKRLEARIAALESTPAVKWCGVFQNQHDYKPGDLVRWGGSVFIAKMAGSGIVPGDKSPMSPVMWDVFSERGRQGKTGGAGGSE